MHKPLLERRVIPIGDRIFAEGDRGEACFVVQKGRVEIYRQRGSSVTVLAEIREGGIFGEMALIDNQPRMASARAADLTTLIVVSRDTFERKLALCDPFVRGLLQIMAANLRRATGGMRPPPEAMPAHQAPPLDDDPDPVPPKSVIGA